MFCLKPKYKYGYKVPCNYKYALKLNKKNENTKWFDANVFKHKKLNEYEVFIDKGNYAILKVPRGYCEICVHTVFDIKHDGRHRARVIEDGHLTEVPAE